MLDFFKSRFFEKKKNRKTIKTPILEKQKDLSSHNCRAELQVHRILNGTHHKFENFKLLNFSISDFLKKS